MGCHGVLARHFVAKVYPWLTCLVQACYLPISAGQQCQHGIKIGDEKKKRLANRQALKEGETGTVGDWVSHIEDIVFNYLMNPDPGKLITTISSI